jgi:hypothetical protein
MIPEKFKTLEARVNFLFAIKRNKPRRYVIKKFIKYYEEYQELGGRQSVKDKVNYREDVKMYEKYIGENMVKNKYKQIERECPEELKGQLKLGDFFG